jgi:hypothetical protein
MNSVYMNLAVYKELIWTVLILMALSIPPSLPPSPGHSCRIGGLKKTNRTQLTDLAETCPILDMSVLDCRCLLLLTMLVGTTVQN